MGFLGSSCSFTRFRVIDPVPDELWAEIPQLLKKGAILDIDETTDSQADGWVSFDDYLDTTWQAGPPQKGAYMAFSLRLDIRRSSSIKDGDEIVGSQTKVKVVKNKVAPPFRKAEFEISFGEGISHVGEVVDLGVELDIIKKSGSWFSYNDSKIGQGRDAVKKILQDNPELCDEIEAKIIEVLNAKKDA